MTLKSVRAMRQTHAEVDKITGTGYELSRREAFSEWVVFYCPLTRRWMPKVWLWWGYNVQGYPKPPPFPLDPVARHFGFVEGVPACQGPVCQEHEWPVGPYPDEGGLPSDVKESDDSQ